MKFVELLPYLLAWSSVLMLAFVAWTMWPRHRTRLESLGRIPLEDDR